MERRQFIRITLSVIFTGGVKASSSKEDVVQLTFGVVADPQYADVTPRGSRFYQNSLAKLKTAVDEFNRHALDRVITMGDVIDRDLLSFSKIMPLYQKLNAPCRFVLGNHDFSVEDNDKVKVQEKLGMKEAYYAETHGDWRLIYLDGNDVSTYRYPKDSHQTQEAEKVRQGYQKEGRPQAKTWNGAIGRKQFAWFENELEDAKQKKLRVIVMNHFPVFPIHDGHNLWNDQEMVDLISKHPHVVAYLNGHNHRGQYAVHRGCHYLNFKGMVETQDASAYAIVRCYQDRIEVDGFSSEPDRKLL